MEMKDIRGYKIDFGARVMVVNHKFAKAASQWSSPEYNLMKTILSEFPDMTVVEAAGRHNKTCHHDKNLTYKNMETYISIQPNAAELMAAYWIARTEAAPQTSRYAYVRKWFISQFPKYDEVPLFSEDETTVVAIDSDEEKVELPNAA